MVHPVSAFSDTSRNMRNIPMVSNRPAKTALVEERVLRGDSEGKPPALPLIRSMENIPPWDGFDRCFKSMGLCIAPSASLDLTARNHRALHLEIPPFRSQEIALKSREAHTSDSSVSRIRIRTSTWEHGTWGRQGSTGSEHGSG